MLDIHDGELEPTLAVREQVIRLIRQWNADIVIAPAAQRLPPRPPLHRRPGAGLGLHGHGAERLPGHAAAPQEPGLPLLVGRLPAAEPVPARRRRGHRPGDREEDPRPRRPRVAGLRVAAVDRGHARLRAEGRGGAPRLAAPVARGPAASRRREGRAAQVVRAEGARR